MESFVSRSAALLAALLFTLACASGGAIAQTPALQSKEAAEPPRVQLHGAPLEILDAAIEGHPNVWRRRDESGWIEHVSSGLACPARQRNYTLIEIAFYGGDVPECSYSDEQGEVRLSLMVTPADGLPIMDLARKGYRGAVDGGAQPVRDPAFENFGDCEAARFQLRGPNGEGTVLLVAHGAFVFGAGSVSHTRTPESDRSTWETAHELLAASVRC